MSRGTDRLAQDLLAHPRLQRLHQDQVHSSPQQVLESQLEVHVAIEGVPVEVNQEVDVAIRCRFIAGEGAEQRERACAQVVELPGARGQSIENCLAVQHALVSLASAADGRESARGIRRPRAFDRRCRRDCLWLFPWRFMPVPY